MRGILTPQEVDASTPTQIAVLLDYDVDPSIPTPTAYDRSRDRQVQRAVMPGYCEHGNLAPQCRECRNTIIPDPNPEGDSGSRRGRLRRVV